VLKKVLLAAKTESAALDKAKHPNVITNHGIDTISETGQVCLLLELASEGSFSDYVKKIPSIDDW